MSVHTLLLGVLIVAALLVSACDDRDTTLEMSRVANKGYDAVVGHDSIVPLTKAAVPIVRSLDASVDWRRRAKEEMLQVLRHVARTDPQASLYHPVFVMDWDPEVGCLVLSAFPQLPDRLVPMPGGGGTITIHLDPKGLELVAVYKS